MITIIEKEKVAEYQIVPAFVDNTQRWTDKLQYAVRLGNEFKGKTTIVFETTKGPRAVETTVWSVTENYLMLKGGVAIPLASIIDLHS